eukprot:5548453-Prymnesium_polylepis.1
MMEIGAGWGGFATLVKRTFRRTRYIILDIPTVIPLQMSLAHHHGYRKILALGSDASSADVNAVLCCTPFDVRAGDTQGFERRPVRVTQAGPRSSTRTEGRGSRRPSDVSRVHHARTDRPAPVPLHPAAPPGAPTGQRGRPDRQLRFARRDAARVDRCVHAWHSAREPGLLHRQPALLRRGEVRASRHRPAHAQRVRWFPHDARGTLGRCAPAAAPPAHESRHAAEQLHGAVCDPSDAIALKSRNNHCSFLGREPHISEALVVGIFICLDLELEQPHEASLEQRLVDECEGLDGLQAR